MKNIPNQTAIFLQTNPYYIIYSHFLQTVVPTFLFIYACISFVIASSPFKLQKTITTMTIGDVIHYSILAYAGYWFFILFRDRVRLMKRTEALEADLYRQGILHNFLKKYVIEHLGHHAQTEANFSVKSLDEKGYTEAFVRFLCEYESEGSRKILANKEHQLNKTKPLDILKRGDLEDKFINTHWQNIPKF